MMSVMRSSSAIAPPTAPTMIGINSSGCVVGGRGVDVLDGRRVGVVNGRRIGVADGKVVVLVDVVDGRSVGIRNGRPGDGRKSVGIRRSGLIVGVGEVGPGRKSVGIRRSGLKV